MKVVRLKPVHLPIFVIVSFCSYVLFYIIFLFFLSMFCFFLFLFCFVLLFFFWEGGGGQRKEIILLTKIAHLKLPFNPPFKYMTFMYQQHMTDL